MCIKFESEEFSITARLLQQKTDSKVEDLGRGTVVCVACRRSDSESERLRWPIGTKQKHKLKTESQNPKQNHKTQNRITKLKTESHKTQNRNTKLKTETQTQSRITKLKTETQNSKQKRKTKNGNTK